MSAPDFVVCLNCETPCYSFDWKEGQIIEALCEICGADDVDDFLTDEALEALVGSELAD